MQKAIQIFVLCWLSATGLEAGFMPVSLGAAANTTIGAFGLLNANLFPTGPQNYGGVPFNVGPTWSADVAAGQQQKIGLEQTVIPINVFGVATMYTLMNSQWGQTSGTFVSLIFTFGDGSTYTVGLGANQAIRDYNNYTWTNSISSSWSAPGGLTDSTVSIWNDNGMPCNQAPGGICSIASGSYQRLDEQIINLPTNSLNLTLVSLTVVDGGDHATAQDALVPNPNDAQRSFITGVTANTGSGAPVPEPGTLAMLLGGIGAIVALRKRLA